jgi:hypothetical protein
MYDASFVFELRTSIARTQSLLSYEDNLSIRSCLFEFERWQRFRIVSFSWTFWEHSWWASWWFDEWFFQWWWFFKSQFTQFSRECEFHFWSLRWASLNWQYWRLMSLDLSLIVFIQWFLWQLYQLLHCRRFQRERKFSECEFLDCIARFFELMSAADIDRTVSWNTEWLE